MKITFIEPQPPGMHVFSRVHLPRLGPVLLATLLARDGHRTSVVLEETEPIDWNQLLDCDLVGISSITSTAPRAYAIADRLRSIGIPVVLGGPHPTFLADEALEHADWVMRGEADSVITRFVDAVARKEGFAEVPGLSWRSEGRVVHNPLAQPVTDLDTLPAPDLDLIRRQKPGHFDFAASHTLPLQTSRGCPYDCSFCSVTSMFGRRYRFRSAKPVVEELQSRSFAGAHVFFYDDNFTANPARARELLNAMIDANVKPEWSTQVHTDCARHEGLLPLMRRAGCETVYVGFESINPRTLELYDKAQTVDGMERAIAAIHAAGIRVHGMFVFGSDADDQETIRRTARWAIAREIDSVQFLILTPLPGTRVFDELESAGRLLTRDWSLYDTHHVVFRPSQMSPYALQMETLRAQAKFYSMRQVLQSVVRRHRFNTFIRLYAAHHNHAWIQTHKGFLDRLRKLDNGGRAIDFRPNGTEEACAFRAAQ